MSRSLRLALVIITALLIPLVPFAITGELPGERWLSAHDDQALRFGATGAALLAADVLLPIPSSLLGTLLGARLGLAAGFLWTWVGLTAGHLIGFGVGRALLGRLAPDLPRTTTLLAVFLSRPVPVLAEAAAVAAGAGHMRLSPFLAAAGVGNAVYAGALAANGAALLPDAMAGPGLILPMALPVIAWLVWRTLARQRTTERT